MDNHDCPALVRDVRELERNLLQKLETMDEALRRIEERENETWAYRTETYAWLMTMNKSLARIALLVFIIAILSVVALIR